MAKKDDVYPVLEQINADLSLLSESVAAVVSWCREAESTGGIPSQGLERTVWGQEIQRLHTERSVLQDCLQQLNGAVDIDALRAVLGTRIDALTERMAALENKNVTEHTRNT